MKKLVKLIFFFTILLLLLTGCNKIKILPPKLQSVEIVPGKIKAYTGESIPLSVRVHYNNGDVEYPSAEDLQLFNEGFHISGNYLTALLDAETETKHLIELGYGDHHTGAFEVEIVSNPLDNYTEEKDGKRLIKDSFRIDVLVNKQYVLSADAEPPNLRIPDIRWPVGYTDDLEKKYMRDEAATALEKLFIAAEEAGHKLYGVSGYRSYKLQANIFAYNVQRRGSEELANKTSARPGESEHQTGLVMDIASETKGTTSLVAAFGETPEGEWVAAHCAEFGFILRYPLGKEEITGYSYEPWHLRYVGEDLAKAIMESGLTMEEYFSQLSLPTE